MVDETGEVRRLVDNILVSLIKAGFVDLSRIEIVRMDWTEEYGNLPRSVKLEVGLHRKSKKRGR